MGRKKVVTLDQIAEEIARCTRCELHKHRHNFVKGHSMAGRRGQIEPESMAARHEELAIEMVRRGYRHESPYDPPNLDYLPPEDRFGRVDRVRSLRELWTYCDACRES